MGLEIFVDIREPNIITEELEQLGVKVHSVALEVGDYSLGEGIFIERKTGADFVNSLTDGRLFEQLNRLTESSTYPLLILEDFESTFENPEWRIRKKQVFGAISYISTRLFVSIVPTGSASDTAILLERLCSWFQEDKVDPLFLSRGVKKSMSLTQKQEYLLQGLPGIGPKMSQILLKEFSTPINIIDAIRKTEITFTKSGRIKGLKGPLETVKGLGPKTVLALKEVLENKGN